MTFSIVARDPDTGAFGVATATGGPCVGALVPNIRAGVGAIATQGDTNPYYGIDGLRLLEQGRPATAIVDELVMPDAGRSRRQMIAIGGAGAPAMFSGNDLENVAGMHAEKDFAVAGNMLENEAVLREMAAAFEASSARFEDRLLAALRAAQAAGGDKRGTQSAALLIYTDTAYATFDCRVDLSPDPIDTLANVVKLSREGEYAAFLAGRPRK